MDDKHFFDKIAPEWDKNEILSTNEKVNSILNSFKIKFGDQILDLGTGTGILLPYLAKRIGKNGKITAVDYSEGMLQRAKEKYSDLNPLPEFINLDFENDTIIGEYDKIILYCVYPHLHKPVETLKWLRTVNLKNNGSIYIAFPCGPDFINNIHKDRHSESDRLLSAKELAEHLDQEGIRAIPVKDTEEEYIIEIPKN